MNLLGLDLRHNLTNCSVASQSLTFFDLDFLYLHSEVLLTPTFYSSCGKSSHGSTLLLVPMCYQPVCSAAWIALLFTGVLSTGFHMHEWGEIRRETLTLGPQEIGRRMILPSSHIWWFPIFVCMIVGEITRSGVKSARGWILLDHLWFFSLPRHPQLSALIFF